MDRYTATKKLSCVAFLVLCRCVSPFELIPYRLPPETFVAYFGPLILEYSFRRSLQTFEKGERGLDDNESGSQ